MNVNDIISENTTNEAIPFTQQWKMQRAAGKATKQNLKQELQTWTAEFVNYLKHSNQKATPDSLEKYLDQKGLSDIAKTVISGYEPQASAGERMSGLAHQAGKAVGKGMNAVKNMSNTPKPEFKSNRSDIPGPTPVFKSSRSAPAPESESIVSEIEGDTVLSKADVQNIFKVVLQKAYANAAQFSKSKFAPGSNNSQTDKNLPSDVSQALDVLKKHGYKIQM